MWPVSGNGAYAIGNREVGPDKKRYSDGSYDPSGRARGGNRHFGRDLKNKLGQPVYAAESGTLYMVDSQYKTLLDKNGNPILGKDKKQKKSWMDMETLSSFFIRTDMSRYTVTYRRQLLT